MSTTVAATTTSSSYESFPLSSALDEPQPNPTVYSQSTDFSYNRNQTDGLLSSNKEKVKSIKTNNTMENEKNVSKESSKNITPISKEKRTNYLSDESFVSDSDYESSFNDESEMDNENENENENESGILAVYSNNKYTNKNENSIKKNNDKNKNSKNGNNGKSGRNSRNQKRAPRAVNEYMKQESQCATCKLTFKLFK